MGQETTDPKRRGQGPKGTKEALQEALSLLTATIESTADGLLVIDNQGKVTIYNKKFLSLWDIPEALAARQDDQMLLDYVTNQLKDPDAFIQKVKQLYSLPEAESLDVLEFKDGRVFERLSRPQRRGDKIIGRVWSFRDVTERRRAEEGQRQDRASALRLAEEIAVIAEIGRLVGSTLDIDEVYERFAVEARKLIPFERLAINHCNFQEDAIRIAYTFGTDVAGRQQGDSLPLAGTLSEAVLIARSGLIIQSANMDEILCRFPALAPTLEAGMRSLLSVPLVYREEGIGVLHFRSTKQDNYTTKDLRLAERIGEQIAGAIAHAWLFAELKNTEQALRLSEGRFRALFEQAAVGVAEIDVATGRFLMVNRRLCELTGKTEEELLACTFREVMHPDDLAAHEDMIAQLATGKISNYSMEKRCLRKEGGVVWANIAISVLWKSGEAPGRGIAVIQDISDRKRVEEEKERHARQLTMLHKTSVELTAELNLKELLQTLAQRSLHLIGGRYCNCYLYRPELDLMERVAQAGRELFSTGETRQRGEGFVGHIWATGVPLLVDDYHAWSGRKRACDAFPSRTLVGAPIFWGEEFLGVLSVMAFLPHRYTKADLEMLEMFATQAAIVIRNARLYGKIEQIAVTDELTGLFNRRGYFQLGEREFERTLRFNRPLAALMLDIDHFKLVNDIHGHACGDQVLRELADCLRQNTRGIDVAGRYGGEEFALLMPETLLPEAMHLAERLRQSVAGLIIPACPAPGDFPPDEIRITASIGVAILSKNVPSLADLLGRADHAMYRAKAIGRNRVVAWEEKDICLPGGK